MNTTHQQHGYVMALVVIIVSALLSTAVIATALTSITDLEQSQTVREGLANQLTAESCVNESLLHLSRDDAYTGSTFALDQLTCTVVVTGSGGTRDLQVEGTDGTYTALYAVSVNLDPLFITSWSE